MPQRNCEVGELIPQFGISLDGAKDRCFSCNMASHHKQLHREGLTEERGDHGLLSDFLILS